uniref:Uncharacterized protein n=1 Tax=Cacopsylla melanoneura TaxID=428564 RepID=A0A8D8ZDM5_9HEMI
MSSFMCRIFESRYPLFSTVVETASRLRTFNFPAPTFEDSAAFEFQAKQMDLADNRSKCEFISCLQSYFIDENLGVIQPFVGAAKTERQLQESKTKREKKITIF